MKLRILSVESMIVLTKFWLTDPVAVALWASHPMGEAVRAQLQAVYELLLTLDRRRNQSKAEIRQLTHQLQILDDRHDRSARAMYHHIQALRQVTEDPDVALLCEQLLAICFPDGLAIVNRAYRDEGGFAEALAVQMTTPLRARMAQVMVGAFTLDELSQRWIRAGIELGQKSLERDRLQVAVASTGASPAAIRANVIRSHWIGAVRNMETSIAMMELSEGQRESLMAPLLRSIASVEQNLPVAEVGDGEGEGDDGAIANDGGSAGDGERDGSGTFDDDGATDDDATDDGVTDDGATDDGANFDDDALAA